MLWWLVTWVLLFGLYLLLSGQASGEELVAAALSAAAAVGSGLLVRRFGGPRVYRFRAAWLTRAAVPLKSLLLDLLLVGRVLLGAMVRRAAGGIILRQPFDDRDDTPLAAARGALVVLGASFAPNTVALGIAPRRLVLHRLQPRPPSPDREWPV